MFVTIFFFCVLLFGKNQQKGQRVYINVGIKHHLPLKASSGTCLGDIISIKKLV